MELLAIALFSVAIGAMGYTCDRRDWNGGFCRESGKPWVQFDTASDGSRGYRDGPDNYIWISYPVDHSKVT